MLDYRRRSALRRFLSHIHRPIEPPLTRYFWAGVAAVGLWCLFVVSMLAILLYCPGT